MSAADTALRQIREAGLSEVAIVGALNGLLAGSADEPPMSTGGMPSDSTINDAVGDQIPVANLAIELLDELDASSDQRWRWIQRFQKDWRESTVRRAQWVAKVKDLVRRLQESGQGAQADQLMTDLLSNQLVSQLGKSSLIWATGHGKETVSMTFKGIETAINESEPSSATSRNTEAGNLATGMVPAEVEKPAGIRCQQVSPCLGYRICAKSSKLKFGQCGQQTKRARSRGKASLEGRSTSVQAISRDYSHLPIKTLVDLCKQKGIDVDGLKLKGANFTLAWKLARHDLGPEGRTERKGRKTLRTKKVASG